MTVSLLSCVTDYRYAVVLQNDGTSKLTDTTVVYDGFRSIGGNLIPKSKKTHLSPRYPIPDKATVVWRTPDGVLHEKEVEVKRRVPAKFHGDIFFKIDDQNNVTVEPHSPLP